MLIHKILTAPQWATLRDDGVFAGAPIDLADGYVHLSTGAQSAETLAKHFAGQTGLVLAAIDTEHVDVSTELRWEHAPSRGEDFPHLYRALRLTDVVWAAEISDADGAHRLPALDGSGDVLHRS